MLEVTGNDISLTRGDTARLTVTITNICDDGLYVPSPDDVFKLTVKESVYDSNSVFQKVSTGNPIFKIDPIDTKELDFRRYVYDIELETKNGEVYTIVPYSGFRVTKEVTTW